jgi:hypothetical protein
MGKEMKLIWKGDTRLGPELADSMIELAEPSTPMGGRLPGLRRDLHKFGREKCPALVAVVLGTHHLTGEVVAIR